VLLGSLLNALFASYVLPYGWEFSLAFSYGAVQAATDPVAVVSLLNELGAPPSLTMIVSGESLLNDGSAMVVYSLFFAQYLGENRNVVLFLLQLVLGGIAVGLAFGAFVLYWMSLLNRRHDHTDVTIQVRSVRPMSANLYFFCVPQHLIRSRDTAACAILPWSTNPFSTQVALTILGAYACFYTAEGIFGVSGVLAVVTTGVTLAATFWPIVISRYA
jgi:NhaP-type Na+/H+ or K+/H+ antiporter